MPLPRDCSNWLLSSRSENVCPVGERTLLRLPPLKGPQSAAGSRTLIAICISLCYRPLRMWRVKGQHEKQNRPPWETPSRFPFFFAQLAKIQPQIWRNFPGSKVRHAANLAPTQLLENNQSHPSYPETHFRGYQPPKIGVFNHPQFYGLAAVDREINDASFGQIVNAAAPRLFQLAAKFGF